MDLASAAPRTLFVMCDAAAAPPPWKVEWARVEDELERLEEWAEAVAGRGEEEKEKEEDERPVAKLDLRGDAEVAAEAAAAAAEALGE